MLFTDDIVLVDESRTRVDLKLELWRQMSKIEYMKCDFSATTQEKGYLRKTSFAT
jgi:hypothetical protein